MFVVIQHEVRDPATFWCVLSEEMEHLPSGLALIQSLPSSYGTTEFSLWAAESLEQLRPFVEEKLGLVCRNVLYPIDARNAFGLPHAPTSAAAPLAH